MKKLGITILASLFLIACTSTANSTTNSSKINLGENTTINGGGLTLEENTVTITSPGTYVVSGSSDSTKIVVDTDTSGTVKLMFNNVTLTSTSGPVLTVLNADSTVIEVSENTSSTITVSGQNEDEKDSAIYAKDDLTITGTGTLNITSSEGDGIHANDSLVIENVTLDITSGDDGIDVNDDIDITNANITIVSGGGYENGTSKQNQFEQMPNRNDGGGPMFDDENKPQDFDPSSEEEMNRQEPPQKEDGQNPPAAPSGEAPQMQESTTDTDSDTPKSKGIKNGLNLNITDSTISINSSDDAINSEGDITITSSEVSISAGDDGIHSDASLTINSNITINQSYEGLEAYTLTINDGNIVVVSSDDGINTTDSSATSSMQADSSNLIIHGGNITVYASGDGIDMNGSGEMDGGTLTIYGPESDGDGAIDFDGTFNVNGGTLIAGGASGMAVTPSETSSVNILMIDATGDIEIKDSEGNVCFSYSSEKSYQNLVIASSELELNKEYTIYENGEEREIITLTDHMTNLSTRTNTMGHGQNPMPQNH